MLVLLVLIEENATRIISLDTLVCKIFLLVYTIVCFVKLYTMFIYFLRILYYVCASNK